MRIDAVDCRFLESSKELIHVSLGFLLGLVAFIVQESWREKREERKALKVFFNEVKENVTRCESMIASEDLLPLPMIGLNKIKYNAPASKNIGDFVKYIIQIESVNRDIEDYLRFKSLYTTDNRNLDERRLHSKRARAIDSLKSFKEKEAKATITLLEKRF